MWDVHILYKTILMCRMYTVVISGIIENLKVSLVMLVNDQTIYSSLEGQQC